MQAVGCQCLNVQSSVLPAMKLEECRRLLQTASQLRRALVARHCIEAHAQVKGLWLCQPVNTSKPSTTLQHLNRHQTL